MSINTVRTWVREADILFQCEKCSEWQPGDEWERHVDLCRGKDVLPFKALADEEDFGRFFKTELPPYTGYPPYPPDAPEAAEWEKCANCRFFRGSGPKHLEACRRFPGYVGRGPEDWCGEWEEM
jgi:hypothetical protein